MRIVIISDTHGLHLEMVEPIPDGDVLIHCGDLTNYGELYQVSGAAKYFGQYNHTNKIFIAGNHDFCFENYWKEEARTILKENNITYLENNFTEIDGLKIYGSPWTPRFGHWAFMYQHKSEMTANINEHIPLDTDILITHGPPKQILDLTEYDKTHAGCQVLKNRIRKVKPSVHAFGHIHEARGAMTRGKTTYINASICSLRYKPINKPVVIDIDPITKKVQII